MYSTVGMSQHISISRLPFSFYFRPRAEQADLVRSHILSSIWSVSFSGHVVQVGIKVFFSLFYLVYFLFRPRGADMPQSIFFSRLPFFLIPTSWCMEALTHFFALLFFVSLCYFPTTWCWAQWAGLNLYSSLVFHLFFPISGHVGQAGLIASIFLILFLVCFHFLPRGAGMPQSISRLPFSQTSFLTMWFIALSIP